MPFGISKVTAGIIALIAGILILAVPDLIRWVVGIFLVVWGIVTLAGNK